MRILIPEKILRETEINTPLIREDLVDAIRDTLSKIHPDDFKRSGTSVFQSDYTNRLGLNCQLSYAMMDDGNIEIEDVTIT
ncbi:hypothetical protein QQ054_32035 [Oscillatoria amoena NRMC-F 0135]|nr:hypothetical protein [Oscillatoria amoena NRMC-F 0135]